MDDIRNIQNIQEHQLVPVRVYVTVWLALLTLTGVTISVSYLELQNISMLVALLIAAVKSTLVALYFMHLRFETRLHTYILLTAIGFVTVTMLLTFADYSYR